MKKTILILFIFYIYCLNSFGQSVVVVLCDVSNSVSQVKEKNNPNLNTQIDIIKEAINKIPDKFSTGSEIYFFPVSEKSVLQPLGGSKIKKNVVTKQTFIREKQRVNNELQKINKQVDELALNTTINNKSCILTSISNGYRMLTNEKKSKQDNYKYYLIILSDMLEYCDSYTNFKLDMEKNIEKTIKDIDKLDFKNMNFDSEKIEILIVSTSPNMTESKFRKIEEVWSKIFKKMRYSKPISILSLSNL